MTQASHNNRYFAVDGLIIKNKKVLLIKRGGIPFTGYWAIPGGHLDFNETAEEGVAREVKEETNLTVTSIKLFGIYSNPKRDPRQIVSAIYLVKTKGTPKAGDDAADFKWFPLGKLPANLAFDHKKILSDYIKTLSSRTQSRDLPQNN